MTSKLRVGKHHYSHFGIPPRSYQCWQRELCASILIPFIIRRFPTASWGRGRVSSPGDPHPPHQFLSPPFRHTLGPLIMERTFKFRRSSFRVLFYVECGTSIHHRNSYPPLYVYSGCKNIIPSNKQRKTLRKLLHYSFFHVPGEEQITFYQSACRECRRVKMTIYFYILMLVVGWNKVVH